LADIDGYGILFDNTLIFKVSILLKQLTP
jgi:hypothetical protein